MTHFRVRNDISVATLSRIVTVIGNWDIGCTPAVQIRDILDVRIVLQPPQDPEIYDEILAAANLHLDMPRGALKIAEGEA